MADLNVNSIGDASGGNTATVNGYAPTESNMAGRNRIINGGFDIWQRGTSLAASSSNITYTADRFAARPNSSTNTTVSRSTDAPTEFLYSALITRDSGQTGGLTRFQTALETINMVSLRGKVVTLSFYAKADSGYTPTSSSLPVILYAGNGTERLRAITSYDNQTTPISDNVTLTTSWQRFSLTSTSLPEDLSQLTVAFEPVWTGTAPSNDGFYITGVQLEVGSVATPFERRSYGQELQLCMRYYYKHNGNWGNAITSSNSTSLGFTFKVTMRAQPTMDSGAAFTASTGSNGTPTVYAGTGTGSDGNAMYVYNSSGNWTVTAVIALNAGFSSEL